MIVRIFTLRYDPVSGGFDDGPLCAFARDKEVLSVRDHFFVKDGTPCLAVVMTYNLWRPEVSPPAIAAAQERSGREESWRQLLEEVDWPLFNTLRDGRNRQAREEGIPAYVICTNRHLAAIAHERPASLSQLGAIDGLGRAKLDRYGVSLLSLVSPPASSAKAEEVPDGSAHGE